MWLWNFGPVSAWTAITTKPGSLRAREVAQWLGALGALAEGSRSDSQHPHGTQPSKAPVLGDWTDTLL